MAMKVTNYTLPGVPDLTQHNRVSDAPRPAVCVVCTKDDNGYYAAYEGIVLIHGDCSLAQENALELIMYRGRKLNVKRASDHFSGIADKYRH